MTGGGQRDALAVAWPTLHLDEWKPTYETLHMWLQIVGKTRLALAPMENHWWQVTLYVTPHGLTTSSIPCGSRTFAVDFDFIEHQLRVQVSDGSSHTLSLFPQSVAEFHGSYFRALESLGLKARIHPTPVEVETAIPFAKDRVHASYDREAANRCWRLLFQADRVLKRFRSRFLGKASPVHFFWGSFDLAMTRFSGRPAPLHPGGAPNCPNYVMEEAYSRECSSFGFWPGGGAVVDPLFYSYAYPEPAGYDRREVQPAGAAYSRDLREFILPYEDVRHADDPDEAVMAFFQAAYEAAADLGGWDRPLLDR
jgi:hypothetical protein